METDTPMDTVQEDPRDAEVVEGDRSDGEVVEGDRSDAEVVEGDLTDAEVVEGEPMEADDVKSNLDECADSDSDSDSKWKSWRKSMFWYELPKLRAIPDYGVMPYPCEEKDKEWKGKDNDVEEGRGRRVKEEEGGVFLMVADMTWLDLSQEQRTRGRWEEHPRIEHQRMVGGKSAASSSSCLERVVDAQQQSLCTSAEVLDVRMEMHSCYEKGISYRCLFKSESNRDELLFHNVCDEPYMIYVMRCQRETRKLPYAHVFPKLHSTDPQISCKWVRPTTKEGDKQYLQFFPQLMQATEFGETKDHVLAKAIVLARKSFKKMLRFQIDIAVEDCMELMKIEEAMRRRYDLYYFAVSEIVLNEMEFGSVLKSIRDGDSGLRYGHTEFASCTDLWDGHIENIVGYLVDHFRSERQHGMYNEWVCDKVDAEVAGIVCQTVDALVPSPCHLYVRFLRKKWKLAEELGLVTSDKDINLECVSTTDMPVISKEQQEAGSEYDGPPHRQE